jgi:hypothetical protein
MKKSEYDVMMKRFRREVKGHHVLWEKYSNLHELFESLLKLTCDYYDDTEEWKQKLQLLWNTIPIDFNLDTGEVSDLGTKKQWRKWLKKFQEALQK